MTIKVLPRDGTEGPAIPSGSEILGANIASPGNMWLSTGQPITERTQFVTDRLDATKAYLKTDGTLGAGLGNFSSYTSGHWNGGTAQVAVVENGRYKFLGTGVITSTITNTTAATLGAGVVSTTTTVDVGLSPFYRSGGSVWFSVRAVDGSNLLGERSAWVEYVLPASPTATAGLSNTTSNISYTEGGVFAAPTGVAAAAKSGDADGTVQVTWNAVSGASGYVVYMCQQNPANDAITDENEYVELVGLGQSIPANAHVILSKIRLRHPTTFAPRIWGASSANLGLPFLSNFSPEGEEAGTAWYWEAYTDSDSAPSGVDAAYFARLPFAVSNDEYRTVLHAGNRQSFYKVLTAGNSYQAKILMRSTGAASGTLSIDDVDTGSSTSIDLTDEWSWVEVSFSRSATLTSPGVSYLTLNFTQQVDIAALEVYDTSLSKDDLDPLEASYVLDGMWLRDHRQIKPGRKTGHIDDITNSNGFGARKSSLHSFLRHCEINSLRPWLQLEWHQSPNERRDFIAYMAAPVSSGHPMALKRQGQGQTAPWVDVFDQIMLEEGNEAWQSGAVSEFWFAPSGLVDQKTREEISRADAHGLICAALTLEMQKSPHWQAFREKTYCMVGGWANSAFGSEAAQKFPEADYTSIAGYSGSGWDIGGSLAGEDGETFTNMLRSASDEQTDATRAAEAAAAGVAFATYEDGPGYFNTGLTGAETVAQEVVNKSRARGTGDLESVIIRMIDGSTLNMYYYLGSGNEWRSHSHVGHQGDMHPPYGLRWLVQGFLGPCTVSTLTTSQSPTFGDGRAAIAAYMLTSVADDSNRIVVAFNRRIDPSQLEVSDPDYSATPSGTEPITIDTGLSSATGLEYHANVGGFRDHNRYPVGQRLNDAGTAFVSDSRCVAFDFSWITGSVPGNLNAVVIDNTFGADASGLQAGCCVLLKITGCVEA